MKMRMAEQEKEIRKLEAGKELDALIAEKVMGNAASSRYDFSTDIYDAWKIVEHKLSQGFDYESRSLIDNQFAFIFHDMKDWDICIAGGVGYVHKIKDIDAPWEWQAKAKSLPVAICQAALLMGLRDEDEQKES